MISIYILLRLFIAHIIADFFLQPAKWVENKKRKRIKSIPLIYHAVTHGLLAYLLVFDWKNIGLPIAIMIIHWLIDVFKVYQKSNFFWFVFDQVLHLVSLIVLWALFYGELNTVWEFIFSVFQNKHSLWLLIGYLFILNPTSIIIDIATQKWQKDISKKDKGLTNAGKWIGMLERILTLTLILINQFAAIGFLIAAKSIFRFGDLTKNKEQKLTEYILIGTFLSFTITLLVGLLLINQAQ
jgi:hypothetical protein